MWRMFWHSGRALVGLSGAGIVAVLLAGCGPATPERVIVSGTVTYHGQPVQEGEIRFFAIQGTQAPMAGARVQNGRYEVTHRGGVQVGTHKVEILAYHIEAANKPPDIEAANKPPGAGRDLGGPPRHQYLPAKYNQQTELELTVPSDSGRMTHNFELSE